MDRAYAGLAGHAVEFPERKLRVSNRKLDSSQKSVRMSEMSLYARIVDNLRKRLSDIGWHPLPGHTARQGQHMHLYPVCIHPLNSFVQIGAWRIRIATPAAVSQPGHGLVVGGWQPMGVEIDRYRAIVPTLWRSGVRAQRGHGHRAGFDKFRRSTSSGPECGATLESLFMRSLPYIQVNLVLLRGPSQRKPSAV